MSLGEQLPGEQGSQKKKLGRGTYGSVYRRKIDGKYVAVKVFDEDEVIDYNELEIMSNYFHPNILSAMSIISEPNTYIVSELGSSSIPSEKTIVDLCQGLHFLHSQGILHLDIKPQNTIQVGNDAKLIDFGSAIISTPERIKKGFHIDFTSETKLFVPPERYSSSKKIGTNYFVSTRSDVFGLGWTILRLFFKGISSDPDQYRHLAKDRGEKITRRYDQESFYFHMTHTKDEEKRMVLIEKVLPNDLPNRQIFVNVIFKMLSFDQEQRPEMEDVLTLLGIQPIPGNVKDVSIKDVYKVDFDYFLNIFNESKIDISYFFSAIDIKIRSGVSEYDSISTVLKVSRKFEYPYFILDDGEVEIVRYKSYKNISYEELDYSVVSCNMLFRMCNGIDSLLDALNKLQTGKLVYNKVNWKLFQLEQTKKYQESSKIMTCEEFLKLYFQTIF